MEVLSSRVLLRPRDLAASRTFYEDVLGLRIYREYGVDGRVTGVVYFLGGGHLELSGSSPDMPAGPDGARLWLQVGDLGAAHAELVAAGWPVDAEPRVMPWGLHEMTTHDPDGVRLVLVEVPEDHPLRRRL
ncbi:MAG: VOC family protein [Acidimicrobiia bacterium]